MRKLKKWSCLLLALLMLPALAACGKKQQPDSDASQNEVQDTDTPQDSTPTEEQSKVLVVYFSAIRRRLQAILRTRWEPIPLS